MQNRLVRDILLALALTFLVLMVFTAKPARAQSDCFPNCFSSETSQQKLVKVKQQKLAKKKRIRTVARTRNVDSSGLASYYWKPQRVASGGWFNPNALTAAHKTLPFGTRVRVTNVRNGKSVVVTINDRGPFIRGRIIDLSLSAAKVIAMTKSGVVPVKIERT